MEIERAVRAEKVLKDASGLDSLGLLEKAFAVAARLHSDQIRKQSADLVDQRAVPYLSHLLAVASLAMQEAGLDEELAAAALLHDSVEDQGASLWQIAEVFGERVARVVEGCTDVGDDDTKERSVENSAPRKETYLRHLESVTDLDVLIVSLADKLHNAQSILNDLAEVGEEVWSRFNVGKEVQLSYYARLSEIFSSKVEGPLLSQFQKAVDELIARGDKRLPADHCPFCGSAWIVPISYGLPAPETFEEAGRGEVVLGGCIVYPLNPTLHCRSCDSEWRAVPGAAE